MNLSDLLHARVIDVNGEEVGSVDDVQLVQDGPFLDPFGATFRVEALAVGHHTLGRRLGYEHDGVHKPWLIRVILGAIGKRSRYVPWDAVDLWHGDYLRLSIARDALRPVGE
jgi:hypothetical protein